MTQDNWKRIIAHVFILCGIRPMGDIEHALYIGNMFNELKNKFNDEQIGQAARQIAETENLYGCYPPLSVWLKYCPVKRAERIKANAKSADFMTHIDYIMKGDAAYFDMAYQKATLWKTFGDRARSVIIQFGGCDGIRARGYKASQIEQERLYREIEKAWIDSEISEAIGVLHIISESHTFLEGPEN